MRNHCILQKRNHAIIISTSMLAIARHTSTLCVALPSCSTFCLTASVALVACSSLRPALMRMRETAAGLNIVKLCGSGRILTIAAENTCSPAAHYAVRWTSLAVYRRRLYRTRRHDHGRRPRAKPPARSAGSGSTLNIRNSRAERPRNPHLVHRLQAHILPQFHAGSYHDPRRARKSTGSPLKSHEIAQSGSSQDRLRGESLPIRRAPADRQRTTAPGVLAQTGSFRASGRKSPDRRWLCRSGQCESRPRCGPADRARGRAERTPQCGRPALVGRLRRNRGD